MFVQIRLPSRLLALAAIASVVAASSLGAQQGVAEAGVAITTAATTSIPFSAPSWVAAREFLGISPNAGVLREAPEALLPGQDVRAGGPVALMIVGGAGVVTGLVVGGDGGLIIATGGAVIGLLGLYRYLR